jgi:predicted RNA-binding Zn-ribbon protein involved in translation (DUF1610 family)
MKLIDSFLDTTVARLPIKGKIKTGCYALAAFCQSCGKNILAMKLYEKYECPACGKPVAVDASKTPRIISVDYFIVPPDIKTIVGEQPKILRVIPAYKEISNVCKIYYAKTIKGGRIACSSENGKTAVKITQDNNGIKKITIACHKDECIDRKNNYCKTHAKFHFILPDVDMLGIYLLYTASELSIKNIISTLKILTNNSGYINRDPYNPCLLSIKQLRRSINNTTYNILQLALPRKSITELTARDDNKQVIRTINWEIINNEDGSK